VVQRLEAPVGANRRYTDGYLILEEPLGFRAIPSSLPGWAGDGCGLGAWGQITCQEVAREHLAAVDGRLYALSGPPYALGWYALR
jgi:hypothetical protein